MFRRKIYDIVRFVYYEYSNYSPGDCIIRSGFLRASYLKTLWFRNGKVRTNVAPFYERCSTAKRIVKYVYRARLSKKTETKRQTSFVTVTARPVKRVRGYSGVRLSTRHKTRSSLAISRRRPVERFFFSKFA